MAREARLIDANELLKKRFNMYTGFQGTVPVVAVKDIDNAITIDPVNLRPKGRWISIETKPHLIYECSLCKSIWGYGAVLHMTYCPNCGAKMEG